MKLAVEERRFDSIPRSYTLRTGETAGPFLAHSSVLYLSTGTIWNSSIVAGDKPGGNNEAKFD